jgi:predicted MFS family arabinose efflux permease
VAGVRNAVFSVVITVTALISGALLETIPFPHGYLWIFLTGFLGAILSSWALLSLRVRPPEPAEEKPPNVPINQVLSSHSTSLASMLRLDILKTPFGRVIGLLFAFHLTQYLPMPVFPIFAVQTMHFSDQIIGMGNAFFYICVSVGSTQLVRVSEKFGSRGAVASGAILLSFYPLLMSITTGETMYLVASVVGGFAWSLVGGAIFNYLLEKIPFDDRPGHLAWYNLVFNAGILIGSLMGPVVAGLVSIPLSLAIFGSLRLVSGFAILRWG